MENELPDTAEGMEAKATANTVPLGWIILFTGLILWGAWYLWAYSPWSTGWTQAGELNDVNPGVLGNIGMTILFTALPTAAAIVLFLLQRRAKS
jgi:TRAP-type C4-dicarboxylate transport system permease small subunit